MAGPFQGLPIEDPLANIRAIMEQLGQGGAAPLPLNQLGGGGQGGLLDPGPTTSSFEGPALGAAGGGGDSILQKLLQVLQNPAVQQTTGATISAIKSPEDLRAFQRQSQLNQQGEASRRQQARQDELLTLEQTRVGELTAQGEAQRAETFRKNERTRAQNFEGTYEEFVSASPDPGKTTTVVNRAVFNKFGKDRARAVKAEETEILGAELGVEVSKQRLEAGELTRQTAARSAAVEEVKRVAGIASTLGEKIDLSAFSDDVRLQLSGNEILGIVAGEREAQETVDVSQDLKRAQAKQLRKATELAGQPKPEGPKKPLTPAAAKIVSSSKSGVKDLKELRKLLKADFRGELLGVSLGTNRRAIKLVKNAADVLIRLRTGAAVTQTEEEAFNTIMGTTAKDLVFGEAETSIQAIDDAITEMQSVIDSVTGGGEVPTAGLGAEGGAVEGLSEDEQLLLQGIPQ